MILTGCGDDLVDDRACAPTMYDSLGYPYPSDSRGRCFPTGGADTPTGYSGAGVCNGDDVPGVVFTWGRLFEACPACIDEWGGGFSPYDCRALVCETDDDCPLFYTPGDNEDEIVTNDYECRNGLCQNADVERFPEDEISYEDAITLCLGNVERADDSYDGEPYCPDATFGETCPLPLPDACLQP
jgi:hypothetical protein